MERKIVLSLFYMGIVTAVGGIVITTLVYFGFFRDQVEESLAHECNIVAECCDKISSPEELEEFSGKNFRITLIKNDGTVLFESDADAESMGNHLNRPEIREAMEKGVGQDTRYSDTIGTEDYYYAVKLKSGDILRVSIQADSIFSLFEKVLLVIAAIVIGIVIVSLIVSVKLTDKLVGPLKRIPEMLEKNRTPQEIGLYDELVPLAEEIKNVRSSQEKMRQEFTANVSHELKTPLTSISGYAELIETGMAKGEDSVEFAGKIRKESNRLLTLIGDIIRLSELDYSEGNDLNEEIDLKAVADECRERLSQQAERRGINITVKGGSEPVKGSRREITDLVYNLVDNSIKYNREYGNIEIEISDKKITVSDTGIGIPKESLPRIFERFYRADKSRSRAKGGTGLGLSIVKHIADRHGARIEAESTVNVGTKITVFFR